VELAASLSGGAILVGFSGGKDSQVTMKLVVDSGAFRRIEGFYMYLVPGLRCFESKIDAAERRYGVKIHRVPHFELSRLIRQAVLRPAVLSRKTRILKLKDIERGLTAKTGIGWFAYGERASDSYARRLYTRKVDGVHPDWRRLWPIWDWSTEAVVQYIKHHRLPLASRVAKSGGDQSGSSGFTLSKDCLVWMKQKHPEDYQRVVKFFPYAEAQIVFETKRGKVSAYSGVRKHGSEKDGQEDSEESAS
jgi:phosphoadenosine phosphosulfate reductase